MMCATMRELESAEKYARVLLGNDEDDQHLAMLFGQWTLEAQRIQRFHADRCETCRQVTA